LGLGFGLALALALGCSGGERVSVAQSCERCRVDGGMHLHKNLLLLVFLANVSHVFVVRHSTAQGARVGVLGASRLRRKAAASVLEGG